MARKSKSEGPSTPDHWRWTKSPDLESVVGVAEREALEWTPGKWKWRKMKKQRKKGTVP